MQSAEIQAAVTVKVQATFEQYRDFKSVPNYGEGSPFVCRVEVEGDTATQANYVSALYELFAIGMTGAGGVLNADFELAGSNGRYLIGK